MIIPVDLDFFSMATSTNHQPTTNHLPELGEVMSSNGTVLMLMDNVVFRKVLPEQIQMAIAAQSTPEDAARTPRVLGFFGGGEWNRKRGPGG
jgi:hypothetical protein